MTDIVISQLVILQNEPGSNNVTLVWLALRGFGSFQ
jgi:hypothetical protein